VEETIARVLQFGLAISIAFTVALWFALAVWAYRDISARTENPLAQIAATLVVILGFVPGLLIYLLLRPRETLEAAYQRSVEEDYLAQEIAAYPICPGCRRGLRDEYVFCPHCGMELRRHCVSCGRLVDINWRVCAFCGEPQSLDAARVASPRLAAAPNEGLDGDGGEEYWEMDLSEPESSVEEAASGASITEVRR
jgi:RNA polymerase subunit RPABC4/transcription elongation factor Spt4